MHVNVDQRRVHLKLQHQQRVAVDRQEGMIGPHNRRIQPVAADVAPANNRSDRIAVRAGPLRAADIAGNPVIRVFRCKRQHCLGGGGAVDGGNNLQQIPVAQRMQQLVAVVM
ncbi:hypothetical protein D3C86_1868380 [compost metagenome]